MIGVNVICKSLGSNLIMILTTCLCSIISFFIINYNLKPHAFEPYFNSFLLASQISELLTLSQVHFHIFFLLICLMVTMDDFHFSNFLMELLVGDFLKHFCHYDFFSTSFLKNYLYSLISFEIVRQKIYL